MDDISTSSLLIILGILIFLSAFFSSSETGMMSINRYRLKHLVKQKHPGAKRVHELLKRPDRLIGLILIGNNMVNIGAAMLAGIIAERYYGDVMGPIVATFSLTLVILVFAEVTPKTLAALRLNNIDVSRLSVEVTETAILRDITATKKKLKQLRDFGISVALDDFGTGYSSLAYLKDLPLDAFKIDRAFVDDLGSSQTAALVHSMLSIGGHMNLAVIAEGVETAEQHRQLCEMGCEIFQGFYFARPMPEYEFISWVGDNLAKFGDPSVDS